MFLTILFLFHGNSLFFINEEKNQFHLFSFSKKLSRKKDLFCVDSYIFFSYIFGSFIILQNIEIVGIVNGCKSNRWNQLQFTVHAFSILFILNFFNKPPASVYSDIFFKALIVKKIDSLPKTLSHLSQYLCNPISWAFDISNYKLCSFKLTVNTIRLQRYR